jgi:hypothetical protein
VGGQPNFVYGPDHTGRGGDTHPPPRLTPLTPTQVTLQQEISCLPHPTSAGTTPNFYPTNSPPTTPTPPPPPHTHHTTPTPPTPPTPHHSTTPLTTHNNQGGNRKFPREKSTSSRGNPRSWSQFVSDSSLGSLGVGPMGQRRQGPTGVHNGP